MRCIHSLFGITRRSLFIQGAELCHRAHRLGFFLLFHVQFLNERHLTTVVTVEQQWYIVMA